MVALTFDTKRQRSAAPRSLLAFAPAGRWTLTALVLILALLLGGTSRQGLWSDAAVQIVSLGLLAISLLSLPLRQAPRLLVPCMVFAAVAALALVQLLPLPFGWWTMLPGRSTIAAEYQELGIATPWLSLSLDAPATVRSIISLLPPIAVFLAVVQLGYRARRSLSLLFVAAGIISVVVGLAQMMQGTDSPLRFYPITNAGNSVGFFANRNHYAALLYCLIPITAAWLIGLMADRRPERWFGLTVSLLIYVALILGLAMAQSRAGVLLALVAALGSLLLAGSSGGGTATRALAVVATTIIIGVLVAVQYAFFGVVARFDDGIVDQYRLGIDATTKAAAEAFQPFGSGLGTFVPVYQMFERSGDLLTSYVNHAHNDWLELWLEGGWLALAIVAVFIVWLAIATIRIWRRPPTGGLAVDRALSRAATIAVIALLIHSTVDYPLRTTALMCLFAFCCALLLEPVAVPASPLLFRLNPADWRRWFERRRHARRAKNWQDSRSGGRRSSALGRGRISAEPKSD